MKQSNIRYYRPLLSH